MPARRQSKTDSQPPSPEQDPAASPGERLQKVLAAAGVGSRRECEELIVEGRVEVDHKIVTELGTRVDYMRQEIRVDGERLHLAKRTYYMVNKPAGVLSTNRDPEGRPRVVDLVRADERLFTVGRLDRSSEGLILLTNDGELANRLAHPRYGVEKTYLAHVAGHPSPEKLGQLLKGVHLAEGVARVTRLRIKKRQKLSTELELVLKEGQNREIRRVLARIGHKVLRLKRIAMGSLRLGEMPSGAHRRLTLDEVQELQRGGGIESTGKRKRKPRGQARSQGHGQSRSLGRSQGRGAKPAGRSKPQTSGFAKSKPRPVKKPDAGASGMGTVLLPADDRPAPAARKKTSKTSKKGHGKGRR
jgi:23S rRNA pseudouridine2605 synthase